MTENAAQIKSSKPKVFQGVLAYFPNALVEVSKVSEYGANKHAEGKYKPPGFIREKDKYPPEGYKDAAARHLLAEAREGSINWDDGGVYHLAQVAWCALAALELELGRRE